MYPCVCTHIETDILHTHTYTYNAHNMCIHRQTDIHTYTYTMHNACTHMYSYTLCKHQEKNGKNVLVNLVTKIK